MNDMSLAILNCPMDPEANDAEASTVGEYLAKLLQVVWSRQDSFSGKRPFGNSGWCWDIYEALVNAKIVETADGTWDTLGADQRRTVDTWIIEAIELMGRGSRG